MLEQIKSDPERDFFCLDYNDDDPFTVYGDENDDNYQRLELLFLPCNSIALDTGILEGDLGKVSPEC